MKPLNADDPTCNPISSNCVIWQGPDIECIKLCKGDTISEVTYKLALELCKIMDTLDISNYDLSCLNIPNCPPENFQQLIQLLIEKICELQKCCDETTPIPGNGCPDCVVEIAPCFYFENPQQDTVVTMQLVDYVTAIGNKICDLVNQINTINQILAQYGLRIANLEQIVNNPVPFTLPTIIPVCVMPSVQTDPIAVLQALEAQFCALQQATGTPNEIYQGIVAACLGSTPPDALSHSGPVTGWVDMNNQADAVTNIFALICDLRAAVRNMQLNCCPTGCDGISLQMQAVVQSGQLILYFTGTIPAAFGYCGAIVPSVYVADTNGNFFYQQIDIIGNLNAPGGVVIPLVPTPVNPSSNLNVSISPCFYNSSTDTTCQYQLATTVINTSDCPVIQFQSTDTSISYSFNWLGGAASLAMKLYDATGTVLIATNTHAVLGAQTVNGIFNALTPGTNYKIRLEITISGSPGAQICAWNIVGTNPSACVPPGGVTAQIVIP